MADLTYLMNADAAGTTNQFYTLAKQYFVAAGSTVMRQGSLMAGDGSGVGVGGRGESW